MNSKKNDSNIIQYKKRKHLNIGLIIFGIILIYLIVTIVSYMTSPHIAVYEVRQGSILNQASYTGMILREEQVIYADEAGYVIPYTHNQSKVRVGSKMYVTSDQELIFDSKIESSEKALTIDQQRTFIKKIQSYNSSFSESNYANTYEFQEDLINELRSLSSQSQQDQLEAYLASNQSLNTSRSPKDGILIFNVDGMEELKLEEISSQHLNTESYSTTVISNNTQVQKGDPVCKILTGLDWTVIIEIDYNMYTQLKERSYVKVHFNADDNEMWADLSIQSKNGHYLAYLTFEDCVRYAGERYVNIELVLDNETGLKIPKSAVTNKEFYTVPLDYITQGGNSSKEGVLRKTVDENGKTITEFMTVDIYYQDEQVAFLDPNAFEKGDILLKTDSSDQYPLSTTDHLEGVYNINKGYVVFKQIQILAENEEYYIIKEGSDYGLSNYDRIILDADSAKENDVVF